MSVARVLPDGSGLDASFSFGGTADQEHLPATGSINGKTIFAASIFSDDPAVQAYRIAYQVMDDNPLGKCWPVAQMTAGQILGELLLTVNSIPKDKIWKM